MPDSDASADLAFFRGAIQHQIDLDKKGAEERGWAFTPRDPDSHRIGDFIYAVMAVEDADAALRFYRGYVRHLEGIREKEVDRGMRELSAEDIARANIGWCFGEGMTPERIAMWRRTASAEHPVLFFPRKADPR